MSLVGWYPLINNSLKDYAGRLGDLTATNTSVISYSANGKIGSTFNNTSHTAGTLLSTNTINLGPNQSMFCWVKLNDIYSGSSLNAIMGQHRFNYNGTNKGCNMGLTIKYVSSTAGYLSVNTSTLSGRTFNTYVGGTLLSTGKWYHLGYTYDGTTIRLYVDGDEDGSYSLSDMVLGEDYFGAYMWSLSGSSLGTRSAYGDYVMTGCLNDIRIYNHTLSLKEIKELSKALVLHYTFDHSSVEGTTNYVLYPTPSTAVGSVGWDASRHPDAIYVSGWNYGYNSGVGSAAVGYHAMWNMVDGIPTIVFQNKNSEVGLSGRWMGVSGGISSDVDSTLPGRTVTISFEAKGSVSGMKVAAGLYYTIGTSTDFHGGYPAHSITTNWKRYSHTFTVSASKTGGSSIYIYGHLGGEGISYVRNIQLEYKDHATEYTQTVREPSIGDSSGLGNDGTLVLSEYYNFTQDSVLGTGALYSAGNSDGSAYIKTKLNPSFIAGTGTVCFWYKKNTGSAGFLVATPDPGNSTHYLWANSPGGTPWNGGGASHSHWYIDGIYNQTPVSDTNWHFYCITGVNISNWSSFAIQRHGDGAWLYRGKIADFRVYNTVLDSDEIQAMYKTRWAANKEAQVFSNAINEDQSTYQITKSGVVNCNELNEVPLPAGYRRIEYIQSTGSSYIDTGLAPGTALRFRTIVSDVSSTAFIITQTNYGLRGYYGTFVNFVSGRRFKGSIPNTSGVRYVITGSDDGIWINGVAGVQESDNDTPSGTVRLMATGSGKMYECMLWDDNTLVRAFVPVIASDGEPCMYDYVTKQCYGSSNTAFTAGGDIVNTTYHDKSGNVYCAEFNEI